MDEVTKRILNNPKSTAEQRKIALQLRGGLKGELARIEKGAKKEKSKELAKGLRKDIESGAVPLVSDAPPQPLRRETFTLEERRALKKLQQEKEVPVLEPEVPLTKFDRPRTKPLKKKFKKKEVIPFPDLFKE